MTNSGAHSRSGSSQSRRRRDASEAGDTLIEILISLMILSITVVALVAAFSSSISASSEYRGLSVSDTVLRTVSEQVIAQFQQGGTFQPCPNAPISDQLTKYNSELAPSLVVPAPYANANYKATVTAVGYWDGTSYPTSSCTAGSTAPQQVTITLTGPLVVPEAISFVVEGSGQIFAAGAITLHPPTNLVLTTPSGDSGGIGVSFTGSDNAPASSSTFTQTYTVDACTNSAMTTGCAGPYTQVAPGGEITGLAPATSYYVTVFANPSPGYLASGTVKAGPQKSSGTAPTPIVLSVVPSTTTAGALVATFTPPSDAPSGETYTATACTDTAMKSNCVPQGNFVSGGQLTGLQPGTPYYVWVAADPNGGYAGSLSLPFSPAVVATVQLNAPSGLSVSSSTIQTGALVVTFSPSSNAPTAQSYTVKGCTNAAMTLGCVSQSAYTSGSQFTGLVAGNSYYATVTAVASSGYLAATSAVTPTSTQATIQLSQPAIKNIVAGKGGSGSFKVLFTGSGNGPASQTYTLLACTNTAMTQGCVKNTSYSSGAVQTGLVSGTTYNVTITANASSGYLASSPSAAATGTAG